jgi:hypothetical protein
LVNFVGMKKIGLMFALLSFFGTTWGQKAYTILGQNENEFFVDENMPDGFKSCTFYFYNNTETDIVIKYEQVFIDFPSTWMVNFCDNRDCLPNFPMSGSYATIKAKDTVDMKLDVFPNGGADTATVQYAIWEESNPNEKDTLTFRIFARWGLQLLQMGKTHSTVYPNPLEQKTLQVQSSKINSVLVYGVDGKIWLREFMEGKDLAQIELAELPLGSYFVRVTHAAGVDTHRLLIAR